MASADWLGPHNKKSKQKLHFFKKKTSLHPRLTGPRQSLEDSQLSCAGEIKTVVGGDVGQLPLNTRLKQTDTNRVTTKESLVLPIA